MLDRLVELRMMMFAASVLLTSAGAAGQTWSLPQLRAFAGLTADQWKAVDRGEIQANVLDTAHNLEVAVVGAARVRASSACFVTRFEDIENFKKSAAVLRIHKFEPPVELRDFAAFALEPNDLDDLAQCRVGDCKVKLSAEMIQQLSSRVRFSQPGSQAQAQSEVREEFLRYIEAYSRLGNSALIDYHDKNEPVSLERQFQAVLSAEPGLGSLVPEFREYMARYPAERLAGVRDFFYWSTESFGLKPVASITHVFMYVQPGRTVTASKQLYASHYFDASLGLAAAIDITGPPNPSMYLVYLNRSRVDLLGGFFGGLRRAFLRGRLRDGMRNNLAEVVRKLESSCATYPMTNVKTAHGGRR